VVPPPPFAERVAPQPVTKAEERMETYLTTSVRASGSDVPLARLESASATWPG
jgi:hypothetical protein